MLTCHVVVSRQSDRSAPCPPLPATSHVTKFPVVHPLSIQQVTKCFSRNSFVLKTIHFDGGCVPPARSAPRPSSPRLPIPYSLSPIPFLFIFFPTHLHSSKTQLFSFQAIPHSLPKTPGVGVEVHYVRKQRRPSRSDGGCFGKGVPSSGENIGSTALLSMKTTSEQSVARWWRRRGCLPEVPHSVPTRPTLCHRVVRRHGEERSGRFLPLNIRQRVGRIAKAWIAALAHHHDLQIIGVPMLGYDGDRFFVSDLSRGNRMGDARSLRAHAGDHLRTQVLLFQRAVGDGLLLVIFHLAF